MSARKILSAPLAGAVFTALIAVSMSTPVLAADVERQSVDVRSTGLDLTTDAGASAFEHRIISAAYSVCGRAVTVPLDAHARFVACRDAAVADALPQAQAAIAAARGNRENAMNSGSTQTAQ